MIKLHLRYPAQGSKPIEPVPEVGPEVELGPGITADEAEAVEASIKEADAVEAVEASIKEAAASSNSDPSSLAASQSAMPTAGGEKGEKDPASAATGKPQPQGARAATPPPPGAPMSVGGHPVAPIELAPKPRGRPPATSTLWESLDIPSKLNSVSGWVTQGESQRKIAQLLGVSYATFSGWLLKYPELQGALKRGKDISNGELIHSAFRQALGYYVKEQQVVKLAGTNSKGRRVEKVEIVEIDKYIPPNNIMTIFLLKNRFPMEYRDRIDHNVTGGVSFNIVHPLKPGEQAEAEPENRISDKFTSDGRPRFIEHEGSEDVYEEPDVRREVEMEGGQIFDDFTSESQNFRRDFLGELNSSKGERGSALGELNSFPKDGDEDD